MRRTLLDTSVYGNLIKDLDIVDKIVSCIPQRMVIYGTSLIRHELRDTPPGSLEGGWKKRLLLLRVYDLFVKKPNHNLIDNKLIATLAEDYLQEYKKQGGGLSRQEMETDLKIIATATIYQLDIVISDDERSMLSEAAIQSYHKVNAKYRLQNPSFQTYKNFKEEVRRTFRYGTQ